MLQAWELRVSFVFEAQTQNTKMTRPFEPAKFKSLHSGAENTAATRVAMGVWKRVIKLLFHVV